MAIQNTTAQPYTETTPHTTDEHMMPTADHAATSPEHASVDAHAAADHHPEHAISLAAEPVIQTPFFAITNSVLTSTFVVLIVAAIVFSLKKKLKPGRFQSFFEIIIEGALNLCDQVTGERKLSKKVLPLALSIFFFVLLNNWLGIMPLTWIGTIQHGAFVPFIRGGTADLNTTLVLGLVTVLGANFFGMASIGIGKTLNKYINLKSFVTAAKRIKKEPTGIIVAPITFFVGLIEIIGEIAKVASLSFRLFGNIFAGEVLLVSMSVLMKWLVPTPFLILEVFVGVIQAVIFAMLTLVYFTIATHDHDHEHDDHQHGHHSDDDHHIDMSLTDAVEHAVEEIEEESDEETPLEKKTDSQEQK